MNTQRLEGHTPSPCPNCKGECFERRDASTGLCAVHCGKPFVGSCGYRGPFASHMEEAIHLHNNICANADWDVETAGIRHKIPKLMDAAEQASTKSNFANIERLEKVNEALVAALERNLSWLTSYPGEGTIGKDGPYEQSRAALSLAKEPA